MVSHPLRMRKALGSNPSVSILSSGVKRESCEMHDQIYFEKYSRRDSNPQSLPPEAGGKMDTLGFEPRAFCMRSGCDTTTPCALEKEMHMET